MRRTVYIFTIFILLCGIALAAYAPDGLSMAFIIVMEVVVALGALFGVLPAMQYARGFLTGVRGIDRAVENRTGSAWTMLETEEDFFHQGTLDEIFRSYQQKLKSQRESGQVLSDVSDYINDDVLALHSWQSIILQIPGTLTGLGILGTFVGLIIGIRGIGFSTVGAALTSVQTLLGGIQVAFYTSICGVILSLLFNIVYRMAWNVMMRNLGIFTESFHKNVVPPVADQARYRESRTARQITELLERLPRNQGFSLAGGSLGGAPVASGTDAEQILMPQIVSALRDGEFIFLLQPRYELNTRKIVGAEALVRWNHKKLGLLSPAVFIPVLESNGYITKLDQYIWEQVCITLRRWIDEGLRPMPLSINVTKTDILAMDVADCFENLLKKYRLPPRSLEIEIAQNAYLQAAEAVTDTETRLRAAGFRVVMDGFDGDYIPLGNTAGFQADALKLDLRRTDGSPDTLTAAFEQARVLKMNLVAEGIENMEQLATLRKCGCTEGQGFFLSMPVPLDEFEAMMNGDKA
ncbi:MAG: EAL domain-containing protein [Clostridia bacterium]|nr:EAL domain-containing protein [Clostridia bacterium]